MLPFPASIADRSTVLIESKGRSGTLQRYGRMLLSIGAVFVQSPGTQRHVDLSGEAAVAKKHAKALKGSSLRIHALNTGTAAPPHTQGQVSRETLQMKNNSRPKKTEAAALSAGKPDATGASQSLTQAAA